MSELKISNPLALHFLMTDDLYRVNSEELVVEAIINPKLQNTEATAATEVEEPIPAPIYFDYLGENNKYLLVLVNEPAHKHIEPKELEALLNILKAKKQELKDVAIVNLHTYPGATYPALKDFFACNSIVLFGINPSLLGIDGIQSNQQVAHQGTKVLATYSISEMLANVDKKRAFWDEMKKL